MVGFMPRYSGTIAAMDGLHTWVINLDKDSARLQRISEQLAPTGLDWTRCSAVLGRALPVAEQQRLLDAPRYRRRPAWAPACASMPRTNCSVCRTPFATPYVW